MTKLRLPTMLLKLIRHLNPFMTSKRNINSLPYGIYSVNYHRIGDKNNTVYDSNVFSCTRSSFEEQVVFYKNNFNVITSKEASYLIESDTQISDRFLVITFDDGYADNFIIAYPILKKNNLFATFFIATDFISSGLIPWWDTVAFIINNTKKKNITLLELSNKQFKLKDKHAATRLILKLFKEQAELTFQEKLTLLFTQAEVSKNQLVDDNNTPLFMNWGMVKEMSDNGMEIGSHTCSHQVLSHLSVEDQEHELVISKKVIEGHISKKVISLAYPVGASTSYNLKSSSCALNSGYKLAFDFEKGINVFPLQGREFELHRFPINYNHELEDIIGMFLDEYLLKKSA